MGQSSERKKKKKKLKLVKDKRNKKKKKKKKKMEIMIIFNLDCSAAIISPRGNNIPRERDVYFNPPTAEVRGIWITLET